MLESLHKDQAFEVVSGWTNLGIPKQAYEEAVKRKWFTVGIACKKAYEFPRFPVDRIVVVGENWGDESPTFLNSIDVLVRVGGGKQSLNETAEARKRGMDVYEFEV